MRKLAALSVIVGSVFIGYTTSPAHASSQAEKLQAKKLYYHANGYIKAIGKNARRTIYHPNLKKRNKWTAALKFLMTERSIAWHKLHPPQPRPSFSSSLVSSFSCIHRYEGAWNSNTGNGYYGGLQMDYGFMRSYGAEYMSRWGTADRWPVWAQISAAVRAYESGRGFNPWPNTARACGLL